MTALTFARPELLWGLGLALLPLLIHLFNRHRARRRPFAAIDFLLRVQRQTARRLLLRQLLLLIARTALLACLALAASGARLALRGPEPGQGPGGEADPRTLALVLDASFSMRARDDGHTRFAAAVEAARDEIGALGPRDRACLLLAGARVRALVAPCTDSRAALRAALDGLEPEHGRSDLVEAMQRAAALLAEAPSGRRRVLVLTDGALHAFPGHAVWPDGGPPEVEVRDVAPGRSRDNHALLGVEPVWREGLLEVAVRLQRFGLEPVREVSLTVRAPAEGPGRVEVRGFAALEPGVETVKVFSLQPPAPSPGAGPIRGLVELGPDGLAEDDARPFLAAGRHGLRALLVNGDMRAVLQQDELFYLERALAPERGQASGLQLLSLSPDRLRAEVLESVQVVFLANVRELSPEQHRTVRAFVQAGGGLFLSCGDQLDPLRADAWLPGLTPWPVRDVVALGPADPDGEHRQGLSLGEIDAAHPVLAPLVAEGALGAVRTFRAAVLEPGRADPSARVLLRYQDGTPALVEGRLGAGRVLFLTTSLDRDWTHWPARASFVPFLQRSAAYLAGRLGEAAPLEIEVGQPVRLPLAPEADGLRVLVPGGESRVLRAAPGADEVEFGDTGSPGAYELRQLRGEQELAARALAGLLVHPPRLESDLALAPAELLQRLVGTDTRLTLGAGGAEGERPLAWLFLLLALGLVLCEAMLIRR